jgi:hypothetical protein
VRFLKNLQKSKYISVKGGRVETQLL